MAAYIFPAMAATAVIFAFITRRETARRISASVLCVIASVYLLLEPGAILREIATSGVGTYSQGVLAAGQSLTDMHLYLLAMIVGLTILAIIKFDK